MNKVILIGRLTRDPELKKLESGMAVATFSVAINRTSDATDFINVVAFDKSAENVKKYLSKGSQAAIDGRIQTREYVDKDGNKKYITEVIANNVEFLGTKAKVESDTNSELPY